VAGGRLADGDGANDTASDDGRTAKKGWVAADGGRGPGAPTIDAGGASPGPLGVVVRGGAAAGGAEPSVGRGGCVGGDTDGAVDIDGGGGGPAVAVAVAVRGGIDAPAPTVACVGDRGLATAGAPAPAVDCVGARGVGLDACVGRGGCEVAGDVAGAVGAVGGWLGRGGDTVDVAAPAAGAVSVEGACGAATAGIRDGGGADGDDGWTAAAGAGGALTGGLGAGGAGRAAAALRRCSAMLSPLDDVGRMQTFDERSSATVVLASASDNRATPTLNWRTMPATKAAPDSSGRVALTTTPLRGCCVAIPVRRASTAPAAFGTRTHENPCSTKSSSRGVTASPTRRTRVMGGATWHRRVHFEHPGFACSCPPPTPLGLPQNAMKEALTPQIGRQPPRTVARLSVMAA
jgi:hypothetical protein